jgi:hypothetical protein
VLDSDERQLVVDSVERQLVVEAGRQNKELVSA